MLVPKDALISDILLWTPTHGHCYVDRLAKSYIHLFSAYNECHLQNLRTMVDRDRCQERIKRIYSVGLDHNELLMFGRFLITEVRLFLLVDINPSTFKFKFG